MHKFWCATALYYIIASFIATCGAILNDAFFVDSYIVCNEDVPISAANSRLISNEGFAMYMMARAILNISNLSGSSLNFMIGSKID